MSNRSEALAENFSSSETAGTHELIRKLKLLKSGNAEDQFSTPETAETHKPISKLKLLKSEHVEDTEGALPELSEEKEQLHESTEEIFEKNKGAIRKAFDLLLVKPAAWVLEKIREHPWKAMLIVLAIIGCGYYGKPITAGLSAISEKAAALAGELFEAVFSEDPPRVSPEIFDELLNPQAELPGA